VTEFEGNIKGSPSISGPYKSVTIDTKSQVDAGPLVHIEKTSDEEIEVDIDGDSEEEIIQQSTYITLYSGLFNCC
jgi:hypothetical protein